MSPTLCIRIEAFVPLSTSVNWYRIFISKGSSADNSTIEPGSSRVTTTIDEKLLLKKLPTRSTLEPFQAFPVSAEIHW